MNKSLLTLILSLISYITIAQVTSVDYKLEYNFEEDLYNCYLVVNEGEAVDLNDRLASSSQFSIVAPFGSTLEVVESFMPLIDQDPTRPTFWVNSITWNYPQNNSEFSFFVMSPLVNLEAYYKELASSDEVKLFSFKMDSVYGCDDVYIWRNGIDPSSDDPDMAGLDLDNGFTMGASTQLYNGNAPKEVGLPYVKNAIVTCGEDVIVEVEVDTLDCHGVLSFEWSGPQSFTSTSKGIYIADFTPDLEGLYVLKITDELGQESLPFFVELGPQLDAGEDKLGCLRSDMTLDTLQGMSTFDGFWSFGSGTTLDTPVINAIGNGMAVIDVDSAGIYEFVYGGTGCPDTMVYDITKAIVPEIDGDTVICSGFVTQLFPATGGTWVSDEPTICTVNNFGLVTGLSSGSTGLVFTPSSSTHCPSEPSYPITVLDDSPIELTGPDRICVGQTSSIAPNIGGTWTSSNIAVATITNDGIITGESQGSTTFTFSNYSGCTATSNAIIVDPNPTIALSADTICTRFSIQAQPSAGGTWLVTNPSVCTVTNAGVITGVAPGSSNVIYIEDGTGCQSELGPIIFVQSPSAQIFTDEICVGDTTRLAPQNGGVWQSSDINIATINNSGLATGLAPGVITFTFTEVVNGCASQPTEPLTIHAIPQVEFRGVDTISVDQTTVVFPDINGSWFSNDESIATVTDLGIVRGIEEGETQLYFIDDNGCTSAELTIVVKGCGTISTTKERIFIGDTIQLYATALGTWSSSDTNIVKVIGDQAVGVALGMVEINFTTMDTCTYDPIVIEVIEPENLVIINTFIDLNGNNIFDANSDEQLPNVIVEIPSLNTSFFTNQDGIYQTLMDTGTYEMILTVPFGTWAENPKTFQVEVYNPETNVFVGFTPEEEADDASVIVGSDRLRCDSIANINLTLFNKGNTILNGELYIIVDDKSNVIQTAPFPSNANDNALTFEVTDLTPGKNFTPIIDIAVGNPAIIGQTLTFEAYFVNNALDTFSNISYTDTIRCSFDPNDKRSWPDRGGIKRTLYDEPLDYTIRFQNTGNDAAYRVEIKDILDDNLDPMSVIVKESSHPVQTTRLSDTLCFIFDNIVLPDSTSDFEGSQGYVSFEVKALEGLPDSIRIENKANIYFDANPPIVTNTAHNTMVEDFICFYDTLEHKMCLGDSLLYENDIYTNFGEFEIVKVGVQRCDTLFTIIISEDEKFDIAGFDQSVCLGTVTAFEGLTDFTILNLTPDVLEVTNDGIIINSIGVGVGKIRLKNDTILCPSDTINITVYDVPMISILGHDTICFGESGDALSDVSGTWTSSNADVVQIENNGKFTGVGEGMAQLTFTDEGTGCTSEALSVEVKRLPSDSIWSDESGLLVADTSANNFGWFDCSDQTLLAQTEEGSYSPLESGSYYAVIYTEYCQVQTECIEFIVSNTDELERANITVYPNPVHDQLTIRSENDGTLEILSIDGKRVMIFEHLPKSIDLSSIESGLYILNFKVNHQEYQYKLIKD